MRVLVAGATGAVGRPLVPRLQAAGHDVAALVRDEARGAHVRGLGVEPFVADVFDGAAVREAVVAARPDVVVGQLTALPARLDLRRYAQALAPTNRLRLEATPHLIAGARAAGARRVILQSISFVTAPEGPPIHDEDARLYTDAPAQMRPVVDAVATMERDALAAEDLDPVVLRYGFFYGPGTSYGPGGGLVEEIRRRRFPIVGDGGGVSSFVHVDDAAGATVAALEGGAAGVFNVCDDEPAAAREWLPHLAGCLGARPPRRVPAWVARAAVGAHGVHFATTLRGNDNRRFRETFAWAPERPTWRTGFEEALADAA